MHTASTEGRSSDGREKNPVISVLNVWTKLSTEQEKPDRMEVTSEDEPRP